MVAEAPSVGLHWLTFTTDHSAEDALDCMGGDSAAAEPMGGYGHPRSVAHECGARVYFGSHRDEQPVVVNMPGEVCEGHGAAGVMWAERLAGVVTRADLALDLGPDTEARGRMVEMRRAWKRGQVDTRIKQFQEHRSEGAGEGWTWYFGGKSAELRLRAYDRRGPLRLEFQWRPEREAGTTVAHALSKRGNAYVWRSLAERIKFPLPWYQDLLTGDVASWSKTAREDTLFGEVIDQLQTQWGVTLWALEQAGMTLHDLATPPEAPMRGDVVVKLLRWAAEADLEGYDGDKLEAEVRCRLKSQRGSSRRTTS